LKTAADHAILNMPDIGWRCFMKKWLAALAALALGLPTCALAMTGQSYATFQDYYKADVTFINQNDNRRLMPMVLSQSKDGQDDSSIRYDLYGDVLSVNVVADTQGVIETCDIKLTAPANMVYGDSVYNDFAISGYHSFAFLMAMDAHSDPSERYKLVTDVVAGIKNNDGAYTHQLDAYTLTCTRGNSEVLLSFINNEVPASTAQPDPNATNAPDTDENDTQGFVG
jgi:hypothetical protein